MHVPDRVIRPQTEWLASAELPTKHGVFTTHVFRHAFGQDDPIARLTGEAAKEHVALVYGDIGPLGPMGGARIPVRMHSECMTSEVFGSLKCDCKEQLEWAMAEVARRGAGAILYLRQEGRGIGLANKIRAYDLQSRGHDTVDANRLLGLPDDAREYHAAADMLAHFRVSSVELMTNNPAKMRALEALGVTIAARVPVIVPPNAHSVGYLEAKRARMEHALPTRIASAGAVAGPGPRASLPASEPRARATAGLPGLAGLGSLARPTQTEAE